MARKMVKKVQISAIYVIYDLSGLFPPGND